jgi:hypothetical protein
MNVDDLRRALEDLPGDMPVLIFSFQGDLITPEFTVEPVGDDLRHTLDSSDGTPSREALVIS